MPLSEFLCRLAKGKHEPSSHERNSNYSTDLSFVPENDFVELVWENGQVQSSRARKVQACNSLPSQTPKFGEKDVNNGFSRRMGKFEVMNSVLNEAPLSVPSVDMGSNHDDDMVPWLSPIESLQHDYCSEFLPELSRTNMNEHSSQSNFSSSFDKTSGANLSMRSSNTVSAHNGFGLEQENVPRVSSANNAEAIKPRSGATRLYPSSSSEQCQTSFSVSRSRVSASNVDSISNSTCRAVSGDAIEGSTSGGVLPRTTANPSLINFSHFQRPGALVRANLQSIGLKAGLGISGIERMQSKDKGSFANSTNACDSTLNDLCGGLEKEIKSSSCHPMIKSSKTDATSMEAKSVELSSPKEMPEPMAQEDGSKSNRNFQHDIDENATPGPENVERPLEPIVASSSVCSGNSVERASDDPAQNRKRKHQDTEESEDPSDGAEEESVGAKKRAPPQGGSSCKRSRAAEVHNLSERRRRDRINEKMRALQELIPNCNKVDKASMLDEAIEYLKTLQLQVQIMSMGAGLYMPSMMLPPGMSHMHAGHMAQFLPMGVGMGFGMGMPDMNGGSSGRSMYQVPPMHRAHYSSQPVSGMAPNLMMFGMPGQGLPIPFACPSMMPMSEGSHGRPNMEVNPCAAGGPMDNINSAVASSSKDSIENMNLQVMQSKVAASSMNQTSNQCQATNELHQSAVVENDGLTAEATKNGALNSVDRNEPS